MLLTLERVTNNPLGRVAHLHVCCCNDYIVKGIALSLGITTAAKGRSSYITILPLAKFHPTLTAVVRFDASWAIWLPAMLHQILSCSHIFCFSVQAML